MLFPASGTGQYPEISKLVIRLARHGCTNRPFFHIVLSPSKRIPGQPVVEQLGTYDPMPNQHNEKLVSLNLERIRYWIGNGAWVSRPAQQLFGLSGLFPVHPTTYMTAWRNRQAEEAQKTDAAKDQATASAS